MASEKLDNIDVQILEILQKRGRTKRNQLAEIVKLSIPAVSERLRKLEERGVLRSYNALLEPRKIGLGLMAFIFVASESSNYYSQIIERAMQESEILECHAITGDGSHILKVITHSTDTLEKLLSRVQSWPGVTETKTDIVLSSPKANTHLPLNYLKRK